MDKANLDHFFCYMLICANGNFYTGWTKDVEKRVKTHNAGKGAAYTRINRPVRLVYVEEMPDRSSAQLREIAIKRLTHERKAEMARAWLSTEEILSPA